MYLNKFIVVGCYPLATRLRLTLDVFEFNCFRT